MNERQTNGKFWIYLLFRDLYRTLFYLFESNLRVLKLLLPILIISLTIYSSMPMYIRLTAITTTWHVSFSKVRAISAQDAVGPALALSPPVSPVPTARWSNSQTVKIRTFIV